jgi:hypothetical protein
MSEEVEKVITERHKTHGDFRDVGLIAQTTKRVWKDGRNWNSLSAEQKEALEMIAHKVGRILSGDPNFEEHWVDIAGYAQRIAGFIKTK